MGKNKKQFKESASNIMQCNDKYMRQFLDLSISMFEWINVPIEIDTTFLEKTLFFNSYGLFFKEDVLKEYLFTACNLSGAQDIYDIPIKRDAYASNGYFATLDNKNSVVIFDNMAYSSNYQTLEWYAKRLANIDMIIDININAQKTPIAIVCDETQRLTMLNAYQQYEGFYPFIFGDKKSLNMNDIKAISTGAPFLAPQLYELKQKIYNEALTLLGISNVPDKKERMIVQEVERKIGGTIANRFSRLAERQKACKKINDMFGLDMWVEYRDEEKEGGSVE